jgi:hypothetical protein
LNITQLYALSIDKSAPGSAFIAGGFQDRGNWMSRTNGGLQSWQEVSGGDGTFAEIAPNGTDVYQSTSNGNLFKYAKSDVTSPVSNTDVTPGGKRNPLFVNPFVIDPAVSDNLYYASGNTTGTTSTGIWRTTNATAGTPAWSYFTNSDVSGDQVSAVTVSRTNSANVLYYGTANGKAYRIDNASTANVATTTPTNITGGGFPAGGYVSSIAVDTTNSANVLLIFSNYNVARVWYSTNSGGTWTDISGNLTGANSPSVRWGKIFTINNVRHLFLATSTGVYYTTNINGGTTTWTQEGVNSIGNVVCTMLDYRSSDNTLVVATHGRGVFQTTIASALPVELVSFIGLYRKDGIILSWATASEINNYGWEIERSTPASSWKTIGFINGKGTSNAPNDYTYTDRAYQQGEKYSYRLKQIDNDGSYEYSNTVEVTANNIPGSFSLEQNFPNPFNPATTIKYSLPQGGKVSLKAYDIQGKEVADLVNGFKAAGSYEVKFDASHLSSGIYFYTLVNGNNIQTRKMTLLK